MKEITCYREFTENPDDASIKSGINHLCDKKDKILDYFKKHNIPDVVVACAAKDYVTGEEFQKVSIQGFNDGVYCWSNLEIYHFEKYNLKLNDDFIEYVLNRNPAPGDEQDKGG